MNSDLPLDVLIIGAGPIGIACALSAQQAGLSYLVVEKGTLVNSLYNYPVHMKFFSTSEKLEINDVPFISTAPKPSKQEALEYYRRIAVASKLKINLFEKVRTITRQEKFTITTDKRTYNALSIVIATGFYDIPSLLNVPGEQLSKVTHYYSDPHAYAFQKVVVVGASNSAVDAALEIYRKGGDVTMIVRGDSISDRVKYWVRPDIDNRIKEGSIKAYFNTTVTSIEENTVTINHEGEALQITNDYVLALTGYKPNFTLLKSLGVTLQGDRLVPKYNPDTMETDQHGVFLAGVICGGLDTHKWFIENSRAHAQMIIDSIVSRK